MGGLFALIGFGAVLLVPLADTPANDPLTWLVNLGVAGIVIVLLVTGQLATKSEVNQLKAQIETKDRLIEAFQSQLTGHALPALAQSTRVLEAIPASALLVELRRVRAETEALVVRLEAAHEGGAE